MPATQNQKYPLQSCRVVQESQRKVWDMVMDLLFRDGSENCEGGVNMMY